MKRAVAGAVSTVATGAVALAGLKLLGVEPRVAANTMIASIAVLSWVFVALYGFRSQWTATNPGRAVLYAMLALALFSSQVSTTAWISSDYFLRNELRFVIYFSLAVTVTNLIRTVWREQVVDRLRRKP